MIKNHRTIQQWNRWLGNFPGKQIVAAEYDILNKLLRNFFGKHALLIGVPQQTKLLFATQIAKYTLLSPLISEEENVLKIETGLFDLPIASGSADLVILPHILEYVDNPRQLVAEACRVIKPQGHIIICGFNPYSFWGLTKLIKQNTNIPWSSVFLKSSIIKKWLKLADFDLVKQQTILYRPYMTNENLYNKFKFLETIGNKCRWPFGSIYILIAQAKVIPLTPIKLSWKQELSGLRFPNIGMSGPNIRNGRLRETV